MQHAVLNNPQQLPTEAQFQSWLASLPETVADVVRTHSPFVPHRLKQTGHTVYIARFQESESDGPPVKLSVVAPQAANPGQADDLSFDGIDPDDLHPLAS